MMTAIAEKCCTWIPTSQTWWPFPLERISPLRPPTRTGKSSCRIKHRASLLTSYWVTAARKTPGKVISWDGCAAPGNKTTHMASLLAKQHQENTQETNLFYGCIKSAFQKRLQKMVSLAGAGSNVTVLQGQDFWR